MSCAKANDNADSLKSHEENILDIVAESAGANWWWRREEGIHMNP
jgi:hypothetical protein